jgi:hypothetical protein
MNERPIEAARDADLRLSLQAMRRAAQRARELAARTGTVLIISRRGTIEHLQPDVAAPGPCVQEPPASYRDKP